MTDDKKQDFRNIVIEALKSYDLNYNSVEYFREDTNVFFKVFTDDITYGLKVCQEDSNKLEDNIIEAYFLEHLLPVEDLNVPKLHLNKNGQGVTQVDYKGEIKRCLLYEWIEGTDLDEHETDEMFFKVGSLMARIHQETKALKMPEIKPKKWDRVLYFRDEYIVYNEEKYKDMISVEHIELLDKVIPFVDIELLKLYEGKKTQLVHGDINPWNVLLKDDDTYIIDFEDGIEGLPLHDLAIMLFYYRHDEKFDFNHVKHMVFEGYKSIMPLPEFTEYELELLMLARRLNFTNYVFLVSDDPKKYLEGNMTKTLEFFEKFKVLKI